MIPVLRNISFTVASNLICLVVSTVITFILPKSISVENYGLFQLYFFYINYTGFLHFGWADGLFLRYGGAYYESLNKQIIGSQYKIYCLFEILFSILFCICVFFYSGDGNKKEVFFLIGVSIAFNLPKTFLQYLLQATNRIKEYASLITLERVVYGLFIIAVVTAKKDSFAWAISADLLGKMIALIYALYQCRGILIAKTILCKIVYQDIWENIKVGSKLMLANIASLLIIGIIRWSIERQWDVSVFGKISLALSISNLMMVFIRAVSMVMLPTLRRIDSEKYSSIYNDIKVGLLVPMFGMLLIYYPLNTFLIYWLPDYADCLKYMAVLFPLCIFEGKSSMLVETYLKTMRLEKKLLFSNILTLVFSVLITIITVFYLENLSLAVFGILVIIAFRTSMGEFFLSNKLNINFGKNIFLELGLIATFVVSTWLVSGLKGFLSYFSVYTLFAFANRIKLKNAIRKIQKQH